MNGTLKIPWPMLSTAEMNKINLHRYVWLELYGYLLHLLIPLQGLDLKIADVESGTGFV